MAAKKRILIVDDDQIIRDSLCEFLRLEGFECTGAAGFHPALTELEKQPYHLVLTDVNMPEVDGFELLRVIRKRYPQVVTIVITGYGTIESAVEAIKIGAYDYLTKPIVDDEIRILVKRALEQQALIQENRNLKEQLRNQYGLNNIIGHDFKMLKVFDLVEAVADSKATVLITGQSGTGKSLIARSIHNRCDRCDKPFVELSCGALPETLLESELFGHVKGSFTGAVSNKEGKFLTADGGTLFLDEINSATPRLQLKLLRVLQERQFEPVGSNETQTVDVRVILASNQDLKKEVQAGRFREDLYYRINVVTIELPPLALRASDIPLLAENFLRRMCQKHGKEKTGFALEAIKCLEQYPWPGNVRELENVVERAVVLGRRSQIGLEDLPEHILEEARREEAAGFMPQSLREALEEPEKRILENALRQNNWNRQATAEMLQINRTTLYKKLKRYGLDADPMARSAVRG
ncbi:MAG: sigma-54-dependent Fis family transcriptional regulator [Sedimentisphaerales bacterium]|nr:sigma-54-dependent Fis family transcriptional regulator [Sedimentisphaerales bacterium]